MSISSKTARPRRSCGFFKLRSLFTLSLIYVLVSISDLSSLEI